MARQAQWKFQVKQLERVNLLTHKRNRDGEEHYRFSLQIGPMFVNGIIYRRETGAILSPQYRVRGWRKVNVLGFTGGIHVKRIREMVEAEIARQEGREIEGVPSDGLLLGEIEEVPIVQQFPGEARTEGTKLGSESTILPEPVAPAPPSPS